MLAGQRWLPHPVHILAKNRMQTIDKANKAVAVSVIPPRIYIYALDLSTTELFETFGSPHRKVDFIRAAFRQRSATR